MAARSLPPLPGHNPGSNAEAGTNASPRAKGPAPGISTGNGAFRFSGDQRKTSFPLQNRSRVWTYSLRM